MFACCTCDVEASAKGNPSQVVFNPVHTAYPEAELPASAQTPKTSAPALPAGGPSARKQNESPPTIHATPPSPAQADASSAAPATTQTQKTATTAAPASTPQSEPATGRAQPATGGGGATNTGLTRAGTSNSGVSGGLTRQTTSLEDKKKMQELVKAFAKRAVAGLPAVLVDTNTTGPGARRQVKYGVDRMLKTFLVRGTDDSVLFSFPLSALSDICGLEESTTAATQHTRAVATLSAAERDALVCIVAENELPPKTARL